MIEKECQYCHNKYFIKHEYRKAKQGDFCSFRCRSLHFGNSVEKTCENCGNKFFFKISTNKRGADNSKRGRFCCKECYDVWQRRNRETFQCKYCGKDISIKPSRHGLRYNKFCDKSCYSKYRQRDQYGKFIDGEITGNKHRSLAFDYYQINECSICGYDKVPEILQVHHKDQNKLNNVPENLEILCPNCHYEKHFEVNKKKCLLEKIECN